MTASYKEIKFADCDVVNPEDFIPTGSYNPHKTRPFLLHDHGFVVAVVCNECWDTLSKRQRKMYQKALYPLLGEKE